MLCEILNEANELHYFILFMYIASSGSQLGVIWPLRGYLTMPGLPGASPFATTGFYSGVGVEC